MQPLVILPIVHLLSKPGYFSWPCLPGICQVPHVNRLVGFCVPRPTDPLWPSHMLSHHRGEAMKKITHGLSKGSSSIITPTPPHAHLCLHAEWPGVKRDAVGYWIFQGGILINSVRRRAIFKCRSPALTSHSPLGPGDGLVSVRTSCDIHGHVRPPRTWAWFFCLVFHREQTVS